MTCIELQIEITKGQNRYIKHSLQVSGGDGTNTNGDTANTGSGGGGKQPDPSLPAKIKACYGELDSLAATKIDIAQRLVTLLTITRSRLDTDLSKVRQLQGELPYDSFDPYSSSTTPAPTFTIPSVHQQASLQSTIGSPVVVEHVHEKPPQKSKYILHPHQPLFRICSPLTPLHP